MKRDGKGDRDLEEAIGLLQAEELRKLLREHLDSFEDVQRDQLARVIIECAARGNDDWLPEGPGADLVAEVDQFLARAKAVGHADPLEVDHCLACADRAFLSRDYGAASHIYRAVLIPTGECEIDLGQEELVDDVLATDLYACVARHAVSAYMIADEGGRPGAVWKALEDLEAIALLYQPLKEMEKVAIEHLPGFNKFITQWRILVGEQYRKKTNDHRSHHLPDWLREVTLRVDGTAGLAELARSTRRDDDLRAWCRELVAAGDWQGAYAAFIESARLVEDKEWHRAHFLDGAALAARELGRSDSVRRLELAWRGKPSFLRLRRWLGAARNRSALKRRAGNALVVCRPEHTAQRGLLLVLREDFPKAAKLLAAAPGLGWSGEEHPGHLLFPLFASLLGDGGRFFPAQDRVSSLRRLPLYELEAALAEQEEPHLENPPVERLLELAGITRVEDARSRSAMLAAMRKAAEKRLAGVVDNKRRRHYDHAALLATASAVLDEEAAGQAWLAAMRVRYNRYPALQREFDRLGV